MKVNFRFNGLSPQEGLQKPILPKIILERNIIIPNEFKSPD